MQTAQDLAAKTGQSAIQAKNTVVDAAKGAYDAMVGKEITSSEVGG
jgi:hypothetical protein